MNSRLENTDDTEDAKPSYMDIELDELLDSEDDEIEDIGSGRLRAQKSISTDDSARYLLGAIKCRLSKRNSIVFGAQQYQNTPRC